MGAFRAAVRLLLLYVMALGREVSDGESAPRGGSLRIMLISIGFHGHLVPLVRLAETLVARGHDVSLATHDTPEARAWARGAGARFVSAGFLDARGDSYGDDGARPADASDGDANARERSAGLMAAALRGFGPPGGRGDGGGGGGRGPSAARRTDLLKWEQTQAPPAEDDDTDFAFGGDPLDARRLLYAARLARHEADRRGSGGGGGGGGAAAAPAGPRAAEGGGDVRPDADVFRKASRRSSRLAALTSLVNDLYLPLARPVYEALYPAIASGTAPDVIVADVATLGARDLADAFGVPLVVNSPSVLFTPGGGGGGALPAWGTGHPKAMGPWQRCVNHVLPRALALALGPALLAANRDRAQLGLPPHLGPDDLLPPAFRFFAGGGGDGGAFEAGEGGCGRSRNATVAAGAAAAAAARRRPELGLVNTAFGLDLERPLPRRVVLTGPLLPARLGRAPLAEARPPPVPPLVDRWLGGGGGGAGADDGVVFVCLGRMPRVEPWQAHAIVRGLQPPSASGGGDPVGGGGGDPAARDPASWRVLWALPAEQRSSLPHALPPRFRVKLLGALPVVDVLAQDEVKVVVSHCGAGAAQEALFFGKPVLCVPFFGDQPDVAARVRDAGAGLVLEKHQLSDARVRDAVAALARNASFAENARTVGDALRAAGGVDAAADALEKWLGVDAGAGAGACASVADRAPWHREKHLDAYVLGLALLCLACLSLASASNYLLGPNASG